MLSSNCGLDAKQQLLQAFILLLLTVQRCCSPSCMLVVHKLTGGVFLAAIDHAQMCFPAL
jgi:hypothetical protein